MTIPPSNSKTDSDVAALQKGIGLTVAVAGLVAIAVSTLTPSVDTERLSFWCVTCGDRVAVDLLLNVLLFAPLGFGMGLYGVGFRRALVFALLATVAVETLQLVAVPGRYPGLRDLISNSLGALTGYLIGRHWRSIVEPGTRAARILLPLASSLWLGSQALTAWAMGPELPPPPWWGLLRKEYEHDYRYTAVFRGEIVAASVGSVPVAEGDFLPNASEARQQLMSGAPLRATVTNMEPTSGLAPIVIIAGPVRHVAVWAQVGRDAVYGIALRGALIGLRPILVRVANVAPALPGDTLRLAGSYSSGRFRLSAARSDAVVTRELSASPSALWALLLPFQSYAFGSDVHLLTALWLAVAWALIGYWGARAARSESAIVVLAAMAATAALGLAGAPALFGLPAAHWSEWLATIVGAGAGWFPVRASRRGISSLLRSPSSA